MPKVSSIPLAVVAALLVAGPALAGTGKGADRDRPVTRAEFAEHQGKWFERLDANGDGVLTQAELAERAARREQRRQERFAKADTDQDGQLSRAEFVAVGEQWFGRLDRNGDGTITPDERPHRHGRDGGGKQPG